MTISIISLLRGSSDVTDYKRVQLYIKTTKILTDCLKVKIKSQITKYQGK